MPRAPRFRVAALEDLHRQLRFAPAPTRIREMDAAERLIADVDPDQTYPQDFVVFRITGYRPELPAEQDMLVGAALISDLVSFVQRLSQGLELPPDHLEREAIGLDEVAGRLNVSTKTLQRYRRLGLVCHWVAGAGGVPRLICFRDALERFEARHRRRLERADAFSRVPETAERRIVEDARRLHAEEGLSLNEAALRLARAHDRAHETMRGILRRAERRAGAPIFADPGPLGERDARVIHRALRRGVPLSRLAARFGKSASTVTRHARRRRAAPLRAHPIPWVNLPTLDLPDAADVILSAPSVTGDLDALLPSADAEALVEAARRAAPAAEGMEHALLAGHSLLKRRAATALGALPDWPGAEALDEIETDLRWALLLKRRLVSLGLTAAVGRIERNLHRPLLTEPTERIRALLRRAVDVVAEVVDTLDPARGQRLDRVAAYTMDRALAADGVVPHAGRPDGDEDRPIGRASARHEPGSVRLPDLWTGLAPWQELVELRVDLREHVPGLEADLREVITAHYGLGSTPPLSRSTIAVRYGRSRKTVDQLLRDAESRLRALARDHHRSAGGRTPPAPRRPSARRAD